MVLKASWSGLVDWMLDFSLPQRRKKDCFTLFGSCMKKRTWLFRDLYCNCHYWCRYCHHYWWLWLWWKVLLLSRQRKKHSSSCIMLFSSNFRLNSSSSIIRALWWHLAGPCRDSVQYESVESTTSLCFGRLQCHRKIIFYSLHPYFLHLTSSCGFNNPLTDILTGSSWTSMDVKPDGLRSSIVPLDVLFGHLWAAQ